MINCPFVIPVQYKGKGTPSDVPLSFEILLNIDSISSFSFDFVELDITLATDTTLLQSGDLREGSYPRPSKGMLQIIRKLQAHFLFVRLWSVFCIAITGFAG